MSKKIQNFDEFYALYAGEHRHRVSRFLHFLGSTFFLISLITALVFQVWWLIPIAMLASYVCAWAGHFFFEMNTPTTFGYFLWSARAGRIMYFRTWKQILTRAKLSDQ